MEESEGNPIYKLNGLKNGIIKDNITILDLSHRNVTYFDEHMKLPPYLKELNLSYNKLENVPEAVVKLKNVIVLDISYNAIKYFDDTPSFCHTIEFINICNNDLQGPPAWIWFELPKKLCKLNISSNDCLTKSFKCGYFEELIQFKTSITDIKIHNCKLNNFLQLLGTFPKAKSVKLGDSNINYIAANAITDLPCEGLNEKPENDKPESVYSSSSSLEDDNFYVHDNDNIDVEKENRPPSSVEDWDSDEYWVPCYVNKNVKPSQSPWLYFVKQKLEEGNFCPIDMHAVPVSEQVNYEKSINPPIQYESDGQFDDYSSNDS
ncbi:Adenylate cyclase [Papilio machaon]|uniref:Adenylate cyclase n=1 Tax=Papilio machaon TaxID=76193 RepID=A0A194QXL8_PAPMA|nr:Adenylate cyclase [Papilio machaon]